MSFYKRIGKRDPSLLEKSSTITVNFLVFFLLRNDSESLVCAYV